MSSLGDRNGHQCHGLLNQTAFTIKLKGKFLNHPDAQERRACLTPVHYYDGTASGSNPSQVSGIRAIEDHIF